MPTLPSILIVDDEKHTREGLGAALEMSYEVFLARDADEACQLLDGEKFDVVLTDLRMAGKSGLSVVDKALSLPSRPVCVMMTAYGNVETAVEAMRRGAYDFLQKPLNIEHLEHVIAKALAERKAAEASKDFAPQAAAAGSRARSTRKASGEGAISNAALAKKFNTVGIIGNSEALTRALVQVRQVAQSKATVLLLGETGTGKELFAQMLHRNSPRAGGPLVPVNCAAYPENLIESELFGHEKGAFTSAMTQRIGRFEAADGGTLFLDEIGEISPATQVKLLRFLETRTFERIGSNKSVRVDIRLVCATNRNLQSEVAKGTFREDLFYRLSVVQIHLPALRERTDDVPLLLAHYLNFFAQENELSAPVLDAGALRVLRGYAWPGNIRELRNLCENLVVMHSGKTVCEYDLDSHFQNGGGIGGNGRGNGVVSGVGDVGDSDDAGGAGAGAGVGAGTKPLSKMENEKRLLRQALRETNGNRTKAAKLMEISLRTLQRRLEAWPELDV